NSATFLHSMVTGKGAVFDVHGSNIVDGAANRGHVAGKRAVNDGKKAEIRDAAGKLRQVIVKPAVTDGEGAEIQDSAATKETKLCSVTNCQIGNADHRAGVNREDTIRIIKGFAPHLHAF